uniref:ATP synthase CF0 subunit II n=1 Tax=Pterothamnion crispum TaxID=1550583 RepID=A0A4D6WZT2_9FLOR|nr:ATP synthase CF0 subunit II [Pterothamnion crispum]
MNNLLLLLAVQESSTEAQGGLFDFNATLPLMALQFLALTVILNLIYYKPVGNILDERDEYIRNSLTAASAALSRANELTQKYEQDLAESRKIAQEIIKKAQQEAQIIVSKQIKEAQLDADNVIVNAYNQLSLQKEEALKKIEEQVDMLSSQIKLKLLNN